jgi:hypothetical protein
MELVVDQVQEVAVRGQVEVVQAVAVGPVAGQNRLLPRVSLDGLMVRSPP